LIHHASPDFWPCYNDLPAPIREQAGKAFELLKANPQHPSLHSKKSAASGLPVLVFNTEL
jgi:hypothetical protein